MPQTPQTASQPVAGVLWMLGSGLSFVAVNALVRWLGTDLPAPQGAFIRFAFSAVFLLPALIPVLRSGFDAQTWRIFGLRGLFHTAAVTLWFFAMARIPIAEVTAIGYLNPVLVTVGAALFFGERFAMRRVIAVLVAILGAVIVLRPGLREITPGHLAQIGAAICFAGSYMCIKLLQGRAAPGVIVAMMSVMVTILLLPLALLDWQPVGLVQLAALAAVALFATSGHYCMTRAFAVAPLTVTQPVTFLQLLWASLLGASLFGEQVDAMVLLGGGLTLGAVSFITWREAMLQRRPGSGFEGKALTPPVGATKS